MAGSLSRRVDRLEQRSQATPDICPEHLKRLSQVDYRDGLTALSPDPEERARYHAEVDQLEQQPPCPLCGWKPQVVRIVADPNWSPR